MNFRRRILAVVVAFGWLFAANSFAQNASNKAQAHTFYGKVEAVNNKGVTVDGEKVEGWMDAMTMTYPVDKPEVLKNIKPGDRIMATVYDNDMTLHNVMTMPADKPGKKKAQ